MEMTAAIIALKRIPSEDEIHIISDSQYLVYGFTRWLDGWKRRGWKTSKGDLTENQDLWLELEDLAEGRLIEWEWIRGHSGNAGNERANELAQIGLREVEGRLVPVH